MGEDWSVRCFMMREVKGGFLFDAWRNLRFFHFVCDMWKGRGGEGRDFAMFGGSLRILCGP